MTFPKLELNQTVLACMLTGGVFLMAWSSVCEAGNPITVNTNSGAPFVPGNNDGLCSLAEAINNVNEAGSTAITTFSPDCPIPGATPPLLTPIDIFIQSGIGDINLDGLLTINSPARLIGPSPSDKARITTSSTEGILVIDQTNIAQLNADIWELRNLEFFGSHKEGNDPGNFTCPVRGGAVCARLGKTNALLSIIDSEFKDNSVTPDAGGSSYGGGLAVYGRPDISGERLIIENSHFEGNSGVDFGGAADIKWLGVNIQDSHFENNDAQRGGGINAGDNASFSINRSTFFGNNATSGFGGALALEDFTTAVITNSIFELNSGINFSGTSDFQGHALRVAGTSSESNNLLLLNSEFKANQTGALRLLNGVQATIASTTMHDNRVRASAGGIVSVNDSVLDMFNSSIVDNVGLEDAPALPVAGIQVQSGTLNLEHVTISQNQGAGSNSVGGLHLIDNSTADLSATLIADNFALTNGNVLVEAGSVLNVHSSQFGDSAAEINGSNTANVFNNISGLDSVQDMGCTVLAGATANLRCVPLAPLTASAVAVDRSDPSTTLTSDQRGSLFTRATGGGNLPDIGAHELQPPIISIEPNTITARNEGNSGTTPFPFTLLRNGDTRNISFANWNVLGEGPTPANIADFSSTSGSAFFDVGANSTDVTINVIGDTASEPDEGFRLALAGLTNGQPGAVFAKSATILNDDALLPVAIVSIEPILIDLVEGNFIIGSVQTLRVTRSQLLGGLCSFQAELAASGGNGVNSDDFLNWNLGTQTFVMQPGDEFIDIELQVTGDGLFEGDEGYRMGLINPSGCVVNNNASAVEGVIIDDESQMSIDAITIAGPEGNSGSTAFTFEISRTGFIQAPASVNWAVVGSGSNPATADDFVGGVLPSGGVGFPPGVISIQITIQVAGDIEGEFDEQFTVQLSSPTGGEILNGTANSTIINDDASDLLFADSFEQ